jgi:hypothetical protein
VLLSRVYVMTFEVCQQCFVLLSSVITQNTADTPQTSLHKHGTITQITADIPQTSLHKHGTEECFVLSRVYVMKFEVCQE